MRPCSPASNKYRSAAHRLRCAPSLSGVANRPETEPTVVPSALPSGRARILAVLAIVVAGTCGALIGYSFADLQCDGSCTGWKGGGLVAGALIASVGVAIVAVLTLRAMDEWQDTSRERRDVLDGRA